MSAINPDKKTIFIHTPKTGGTSIEDKGGLGTLITRHFGIDHYNENYDISKYYKVAFVRNPYDRLMSAIGGHQLKGQKFTKDSFNKFLLKHQDMLNKWIVTKPQHTFICLDGKIAVDFVGRFERLQEDWEKVCGKFKLSPKLEHANKGDYPRKDLYNEETRALVKKIYELDFEYFGYEK